MAELRTGYEVLFGNNLNLFKNFHLDKFFPKS